MSQIVKYLERKHIQFKRRGEELIFNCPFCNPPDKARKFSINAITGRFNCLHLNSCGVRGDFYSFQQKLGDKPDKLTGKRVFVNQEKKNYVRPQAGCPDMKDDEVAVYKYLKSRGFNDETIKHFHIGAEGNTVKFPYFKNGEITNIKYRDITDKKKMRQEKDAEPLLFNRDNIEENILVICEGEYDAMALHQYKIEAVSVPNGVSGLQWIEQEWDYLESFRHISICFDNDTAGKEGAATLAARLGLWRCSLINLPCKDANECLMKGITTEEIINCFNSPIDLTPETIVSPDYFTEKIQQLFALGVKMFGTPTAWIELDGILKGWRGSELTVWSGRNGCLSGDTKIRYNRATLGREITLEKAYKSHNHISYAGSKGWDTYIPTFVRSYKENLNEISLNRAYDFIDSGEQVVFMVTLDNGFSIKATKNHKFLTKQGWKELCNLIPDIDECMVDTVLPCKSKKENHKKGKDKYIYGVTYHRYAGKITKDTHSGKGYRVNYRIPVYRLIYEANINDLSYKEYIDILKNNEKLSEQMEMINPDEWVVHHVDGNHDNDLLENLILLSKADHFKLHGNENKRNFGNFTPHYSTVKSITKGEVERVYDIECEDPHHNFSANGFIVHNSGKSTILNQVILDLAHKGERSCIYSGEMSPERYLRWAIIQHKENDKPSPFSITDSLSWMTGKMYILNITDMITPDKLLEDFEYAARRYGCKHFVIDSLMKIKINENDEYNQQKDFVSRLTDFVKKFNVHVHLVAHPRKTQTDQDEPGKVDIKGSSHIADLAHNVIVLYRPNDEQKEKTIKKGRVPSDCQLYVKKNREFGTEGKIYLQFNQTTKKFNCEE